MLTTVFGVVAVGAALVGCSDDNSPSPATTSTSKAVASSTAPAPTTTNAEQSPSNAPQPQPSPTERRGADGSTGNHLSDEYCAKNQDPGCPAGSYVGPDAIPNPNGDGTWVPCEGTICTNPNHGAGPETTAPVQPTTQTNPTTPPPDNNTPVEGAPCGEDGRGRWVHLEGGNAGHYGTEWLCRYE
ncbi:hypothetical protein FEK34_03405 [Nocardia cyriacigeorgica]|uniref:Uncharacterized protein n=1 Tax=Nocardia cyriacigeorgica TaxID=135487 RepID=A0A5R8NXA1_9NOCA|nr:hypothetical protein [Nocardia cyriacigeorgica]TLF80763.1 hypothetical protein FEK34_03405 [Nocardia cyriacigeorgica]